MEVDPAPPVQAPVVSKAESEKIKIAQLWKEHEELKLGEVWYPISASWWDSWKRFVKYEETSEGEAFNPGPIDNKALQGDGEGELSRNVSRSTALRHWVEWLVY